VSEATPRFQAGDRVRVIFAEPTTFVRTPYYVRGKSGWIEAYQGNYPNPEERGYGKSGLPARPVYLVGFRQTDLWDDRPRLTQDKLFIDIYEHCLEPA
jgi:hypothetical protein